MTVKACISKDYLVQIEDKTNSSVVNHGKLYDYQKQISVNGSCNLENIEITQLNT